MGTNASEHGVIQKYLQHYAECEAEQAMVLLDSAASVSPSYSGTLRWQYCLVVPVFAEPESYLDTLLDTLQSQPDTLLVVVLNQPDDHELDGSAANGRWQRRLHESCKTVSKNRHLWLGAVSKSHVLCIDRYSSALEIPATEGVGLARKIGSDIALALFHNKYLSHPWLACSDADALLPPDYFSALDILSRKGIAACLYPFVHRADEATDEETQRAHELYELRLRQYIQGLGVAKSAYAFHTVGSTMAINLYHYAQVRGFPRRSGGEDFYLLNKLRKTGAVVSLTDPTIILRSRESSRAPFGTGASVIDMKQLARNGTALEEQTIFYNPTVFSCLGALLAWLESLDIASINDANGVFDWRQEFSQWLERDEINSNIQGAEKHAATEAATAIEIGGLFEHCRRQSLNRLQFTRHAMEWLDAFKTLKFIHALRDTGYSDISYRELLACGTTPGDLAPEGNMSRAEDKTRNRLPSMAQ